MRWLPQMHLSTACILLMASSGLMWANLSGRTTFSPEFLLRPDNDDFHDDFKYAMELEILGAMVRNTPMARGAVMAGLRMSL